MVTYPGPEWADARPSALSSGIGQDSFMLTVQHHPVGVGQKVYNLHLHTSMRKSTVNHATKKSPQLQTTTASRRRGHEKESHVVELLEKRLKKNKTRCTTKVETVLTRDEPS
jgi:hypothetical protein